MYSFNIFCVPSTVTSLNIQYNQLKVSVAEEVQYRSYKLLIRILAKLSFKYWVPAPPDLYPTWRSFQEVRRKPSSGILCWTKHLPSWLSPRTICREVLQSTSGRPPSSDMGRGWQGDLPPIVTAKRNGQTIDSWVSFGPNIGEMRPWVNFG